MTDTNWTTILSALLTPTIAVLGAFIAYRQWRTGQNKLKLDLFDRRFAVYDSTRKVISSVFSVGMATDDDVHKFWFGTREAKWFLNNEIAEYLENNIYAQLIDLQTLNAELPALPVGERTKNVRMQGEIKKWLSGQIKVLDEKFSPFLRLGH